MKITLPVMTEDQEHQQTLMVDQGARLILGVTPKVVREGKAARMATAVMVGTPVGDVAALREITAVSEAMSAPRGVLALPNASERE